MAQEEDVKQEVMYEAQNTHIHGRPLFLGFAFSRRRFLFGMMVVAVLFLGLILRAAWMQGHDGTVYQTLAESNRLRNVPIWPRRGIIRDRNGVVLAENTPRFQVTAIPRDVSGDAAMRREEVAGVARLLGMSTRDLEGFVNVTGTRLDEAVLVADRVSYDTALALAVHLPDLPGFSLEARPKRRYPLSQEIPSLSHLLGYVSKISEEEYGQRKQDGYRRVDELGKTGIERSYEATLRGTVGKRTNEVDARGRLKGVVGETSAVDGQDITLTIDTRLQKAAEQALHAEIEKEHLPNRGAVVAMDPRDGSVLALVSWPAYDDNAFSGGVSSTVYQALSENPDQPLFSRAVTGAYPSGSTVKIVVSTAALMEKIITPETTVFSTGGLRLGQWFFPDWKAGGHGITNVRKAIAWSVNTFFYTVGGGYQSFVGLGPEKLSGWLQRFGLGRKTGVDLSVESSGFVPTKAWKEQERRQPWYVGDTYNLSIGQGDLLVTPLQVATYTAAIANGGQLVRPHLATIAPIAVTRVAPADTVETVRLGMRDAVLSGSARALSTLSFSSAAKTGTAQWSKTHATHAWFTSFAPFEQPEIVVTVLLEEGGEGSHSAAPVAKEVLQAWKKIKEQPQTP